MPPHTTYLPHLPLNLQFTSPTAFIPLPLHICAIPSSLPPSPVPRTGFGIGFTLVLHCVYVCCLLGWTRHPSSACPAYTYLASCLPVPFPILCHTRHLPSVLARTRVLDDTLHPPFLATTHEIPTPPHICDLCYIPTTLCHLPLCLGFLALLPFPLAPFLPCLAFLWDGLQLV